MKYSDIHFVFFTHLRNIFLCRYLFYINVSRIDLCELIFLFYTQLEIENIPEFFDKVYVKKYNSFLLFNIARPKNVESNVKLVQKLYYIENIV